jgi:uncharacterized protein YggE
LSDSRFPLRDTIEVNSPGFEDFDMFRVVSALALLFALSTVLADPLPDGPYVSTSASAVEEAAPDHAVFDMRFRTVADTPESARSATQQAQRELLSVLEPYADLIRDRRVESLTFGEAREYDPREQRQVRQGFFGRFSVRLEVDDLDRLAELHHALAGLEWESLSNPEFRLDDPEIVEQRARRRALEAARERARNLAAAAGTKLGPVWGIIHESMHERAGRFVDSDGVIAVSAASREAADSRFALPVEPVPVRFEARVGVVYRLEVGRE